MGAEKKKKKKNSVCECLAVKVTAVYGAVECFSQTLLKSVCTCQKSNIKNTN